MGIAADVAQIGLESTGYENAGKSGWKVASGAMFGYAIGGPVGPYLGCGGGGGVCCGVLVKW